MSNSGSLYEKLRGFIKYARGAFTSVAIILAVLHILFPTLGIDATTIALLAIGALPWIIPMLKSVELPGGIKIELRDLKAAAQKITTYPATII